MHEYIQFPSKKNIIYLNKEVLPYEIIKVFTNQDSFERELYLYTILSKIGLAEEIRAARLINSIPAEKTIFLSYLEGDTLLTAFEAAEINADLARAKQLLMQLIDWLHSFDKLLRLNLTGADFVKLGIGQEQLDSEQILALNDFNFRNFIVIDDQVFGLDFEQIIITNRLTQYAILLAYMLSYNPIASDFKIQLLEEIIMLLASDQAIDQDQLLAEVAEQIQVIYERRARMQHR